MAKSRRFHKTPENYNYFNKKGGGCLGKEI